MQDRYLDQDQKSKEAMANMNTKVIAIVFEFFAIVSDIAIARLDLIMSERRCRQLVLHFLLQLFPLIRIPTLI